MGFAPKPGRLPVLPARPGVSRIAPPPVYRPQAPISGAAPPVYRPNPGLPGQMLPAAPRAQKPPVPPVQLRQATAKPPAAPLRHIPGSAPPVYRPTQSANVPLLQAKAQLLAPAPRPFAAAPVVQRRIVKDL